MITKREKRQRRHKKIRFRIHGTSKVPRFCVFRSSNHIYAQLIDDERGRTLVAVSDLALKTPIKKKKTSQTKESFAGKVAIAYEVGRLVAERALKKKIIKIVFDRGGYKYHGRVKAVAEGARDGGLQF